MKIRYGKTLLKTAEATMHPRNFSYDSHTVSLPIKCQHFRMQEIEIDRDEAEAMMEMLQKFIDFSDARKKMLARSF
jgi:hypothetical protein